MTYVALFSPYFVLISSGDAMSDELWYTANIMNGTRCQMWFKMKWVGARWLHYLPFVSNIVILLISSTIGGNPFSSGSRTMSITISPDDVAFEKCG